LQKFFGYTVSNRRGRPTNREFIAIIAERLRLEWKYGGGQNDLQRLPPTVLMIQK